MLDYTTYVQTLLPKYAIHGRGLFSFELWDLKPALIIPWGVHPSANVCDTIVDSM